MNFQYSVVSFLFQRFWVETEEKNKGSFVCGLSLTRAPLWRAWHEPLSRDGSRRVSLPSLRAQHWPSPMGRIWWWTRKDLELGPKHGRILGSSQSRRGKTHNRKWWLGNLQRQTHKLCESHQRALKSGEFPVGWPWCWKGTWAHGDGTFSRGTPEQRHEAVPGGVSGRSSVWIRGGAKRRWKCHQGHG